MFYELWHKNGYLSNNNIKYRAMKLTISIFTIVIMMALAVNADGMSPQLENEPNVDDIPFSTEVVASTTPDHSLFTSNWGLSEENEVNDIPFNTGMMVAMNPGSNPALSLNDEAYVDDIPFNTRKIYVDHCFSDIDCFPEEAYIEDIPFETSVLATNSLLKSSSISMEENESYINDIPFNTTEVIFNNAFNQIFADFFDEENVDDLPFNTREIYCEHNCCGEKKKIRFSTEVSSVTVTLPESVNTLIKEDLDYNRLINKIMEKLGDSWVTGKSLTLDGKKLFYYSHPTIDL